MTALFLFFLALIEYLVFADSFSQFFQGDALFYMSHRFRSVGEFFHALVNLDIANWYRPLSSQTIPSLFFPWFGLNPYGYHWVVFLLFFATTCVVFLFLRELTRSFAAAAAGTVFFSIHSINVYVTYDFAFAPELFYTSFYVLSCIAYLRGARSASAVARSLKARSASAIARSLKARSASAIVRSLKGGSNRWYALSLLFFVLALMSKEAAVTLAGNIVLLTFFFSPERRGKYLLPFFAIFAVYYLYIVRFLKVGAGDYVLALHKDLFSRLIDSFLWAFDLARGRMNYAVVIAALFVTAYAIASLFGPAKQARRFILFGVGWFFVALSPMLGIVGYFGPYYIFLPLVGIALIVGKSFDWLYTTISAYKASGPGVAFAVVCLGLAPFVIAARLTAQAELYTNTALGYAGRIAQNSARDLKRSHPAIPKGATVYIINPDQPDLTRFYGINGLIKLLYDDDSIDVRYSSLGHTISGDLVKSGKLIMMRYANEGLIEADAGEAIPIKSEEDFQYTTSDQFKLDIFPAQVAAGKGSYTIRISGAANSDAELQYRFNEGPLAFATIHLNPNGETRFFVSNETKRGSYRFLALRILPGTTWIRAGGMVTVTD